MGCDFDEAQPQGAVVRLDVNFNVGESQLVEQLAGDGGRVGVAVQHHAHQAAAPKPCQVESIANRQMNGPFHTGIKATTAPAGTGLEDGR